MSTQSNKLTAIADAIREMDGTTAPIEANDFPDRIRAIETGVDTSDATATADDILLDKTAYVDGKKVTGTIPTVVQATPKISFYANGQILATCTQETGFVEGASKNATMQLSTQAAKTWTPTTSDQTLIGGYYLTGAQTIKGDSNLVASNIKQGVTIFGITGTCVPITSVGVAINNDVNDFLYIHYTSYTGDYGYITVNANANVTLNALKNSYIVAEYGAKHILKYTVVSGTITLQNFALSEYTLIAIKAATGGRIRFYEQ